MRLYLLIIFLFCGCASSHYEESSDFEKFRYGKVSSDKSVVKVFNTGISTKQNSGLYLYLELKNKKGKLVDCDPSDILVKSDKGEKIPFSLHRSAKGKYYISPSAVNSEEIFVVIKKAILKAKSNVHMTIGDELTSKLILRMAMPYKVIFRLITQIPLPGTPEIITEGGNGVVEGIRKINGTTWEFSLIYPEQDQLIYITARSHGVLLSNRYRFQHIELK